MTTSAVTQPGAVADDARVRLGDVLVGLGLLDGRSLARALDEQRSRGGRERLGQVLVELGLVSAADVARGLAAAHGLPLVALESTPVDHEVARTIPRALAEKRAVIAYGRRDRRLLVAVADPVDIVALDDVRAVTGVTALDVGVATPALIRAALEAVWTQNADSDVVRDYIDEMDADEDEDERESEDDAATIRLVDRLISHADRVRASDVHIEPQRDAVRIRMRVDGVLREMLSLPRTGYSALCARLKIIADLDVIERRLPQDGRARVRVDGRRIDVRVSTLPSLHGEKVVLRLLPRPTELPRIGPLGLTPEQRDVLLAATAKPQGLILFTGPTGSGKTNSQYA
ncbi:MAG TPA: ATPase, T2SS/T4P/T4SS family, partial [Candidatus Nanopelagicales bacterium]|nr:ATPase, T2SS/T4P/T4SS family [Candidatus Nanopelagicales bacterium]